MASEYDERPLRFCDGCGQVDRAPRHVFALAPEDGISNQELLKDALTKAKTPEEQAAIIAAATDNGLLSKHMDCCAEQGCPDGTCHQVRAGAEDLKDEELVAHLTRDLQEA